MNREYKIDRYRRNGSYIFVGRRTGIKAREEIGLDKLEQDEGIIKILVPADTWGINPSFFGGMFEGSIKKFGNSFWQKYEFCASNGEELNESLQKDIEINFNYVIRNIDE